jgi:hypothetical protein
MENVKIILSVLVVVLLGAGGYYGYTVMQAREEVRKVAEAKAQAEKIAIAQQQAAEQSLAARTKCTATDNYSVTTLDHDGAVGQDILVKAKADTSDCKYDAAGAVFEIKNSDPEYFKAQVENSLLTDVGTGPSGRSFRLYDLKDKNMVVEKKYFGELIIASSTLTYFGEPKAKVTLKGCKDVVAVKKTIDLATYSAKETKETKCVATQ